MAPTANEAPDGKETTQHPVELSVRKRAKTSNHAQAQSTKGKSKGRAGRLSQLMNMPMDILIEIFGHLHPLDLLHLARTTKAFRRVFMHRSSISVWKASRANVPGFPDCPPDMSEPQWANLAFDPYCHFCYRPNIRTVDWRLRVRLCPGCTKTQIVDWFGLGDDVHLRNITPHRRGKRGDQEFLRRDYAKSREQYLSIDDPAVREAFVEEHQRLVDEILAHADICEAWAGNQAQDRSAQLSDLKRRRCEAIIAKLRALGWGDELDKIPSHEIAEHKLVKIPQALTERIWKNISEPLIKFMEEKKAGRPDYEFTELKVKRKLFAIPELPKYDFTKLEAISELRKYKIANAPFSAVMPEPLDFCSFEPIQKIVDQPRDVEVDADSFLPIRPQIGDMVKKWREDITSQFLAKMKVNAAEESNTLDFINEAKVVEGADADEQTLQLARTVYRCDRCFGDALVGDFLCQSSRSTHEKLLMLPLHSSLHDQCKPLWYPRVLGHRCTTKPAGFDFRSESAMRLSHLHWYRTQWNCGTIEIDKEASQVAVSVVEACGMDPAVATAEDMDTLDTRLECLECLQFGLNHVILGWRSAVKHCREHHCPSRGSWRQLTRDEIGRAKMQEDMWIEGLPGYLKPSNQISWLCAFCLDGPAELAWQLLGSVEDHVRNQHDILEPIAHVHYVRDFAAPELYRSYILFETSILNDDELQGLCDLVPPIPVSEL